MEQLFGAGRDSPEHSTTEGRTLYTSWLRRQGGRWHLKQKGSIGPRLGSVTGELQCCHVPKTSDGSEHGDRAGRPRFGVVPSGLHYRFSLLVVLKWYNLKLSL